MMIRRIGTLAVAVTLSVISGQSVAAQESFDAKGAAELRTRFMADLDTVHVKVLALANAFPEEKYGWRPGEGVRTVAEVLMHIATEWYLFVPLLTGGTPSSAFGPLMEAAPKLQQFTTKTDVLDHLGKAWAHVRQQAESSDTAKLRASMPVFGRQMTLPERLFLLAGDQHEHLGQLIAYARVNGVVPPWSRR
jgi:uncharacterized damage-inducible protein DinB